MQKYVENCRKWQQKNPDWELVCDIPESGSLYIQWHELSKADRMSWVGSYGTEAQAAFEEFGIKECKVETKTLDSEFSLCSEWPSGPAMLVFRTKINGVSVI